MTYMPSISVKRAIVHKIDHINAIKPVLSAAELELDSQVQEFLGKHINQAKQHRYTRSGRFHQLPETRKPGKIYLVDETNGIFQDLDNDMEEPQIFINRSQAIAESLFSAISGNKSISVSDLIICTFNDPGSTVTQIAVLKMDPYEGYVSTTFIEAGQTKVKLERVPSVISSEGLQKCAFIFPQVLRETLGYDLQVLDAQNAQGGYVKQAAGFFVTDFLECDVNLDASDKTSLFLRETFAFVQRREEEWTEDEIEKFKQGATSAVRMHNLDIIEFVNQYVQNENDQNDLINHLEHKGLSEQVFQPNSATAEQWTNLISFEGDDGLQLKFALDDYEFLEDEVAPLSLSVLDLLGQNEAKKVLVMADNNETIIVIRTNSFNQKLSKSSRTR